MERGDEPSSATLQSRPVSARYYLAAIVGYECPSTTANSPLRRVSCGRKFRLLESGKPYPWRIGRSVRATGIGGGCGDSSGGGVPVVWRGATGGRAVL